MGRPPSPVTDSTLPDFADPPVVEAVLGVGFHQVAGLTATKLVQFWSQQLANELPDDAQAPPYEMPIERFPSTSVAGGVSLTFRNEPPPPRFFFSDDNHLVQLQSDWFAYNWRKTPNNPTYEHYETGRDRFETYFMHLQEFVQGQLSAHLLPAQAEVTYVNHILSADCDDRDGPLGLLLREMQPSIGEYLPRPQYANASWGYDMQGDEMQGRLHIAVRTDTDPRTTQPRVVLSLTARGSPVSSDIEGVLRFLDCGREWIVRGFTDITTSTMHKRWGKKER